MAALVRVSLLLAGLLVLSSVAADDWDECGCCKKKKEKVKVIAIPIKKIKKVYVPVYKGKKAEEYSGKLEEASIKDYHSSSSIKEVDWAVDHAAEHSTYMEQEVEHDSSSSVAESADGSDHMTYEDSKSETMETEMEESEDRRGSNGGGGGDKMESESYDDGITVDKLAAHLQEEVDAMTSTVATAAAAKDKRRGAGGLFGRIWG